LFRAGERCEKSISDGNVYAILRVSSKVSPAIPEKAKVKLPGSGTEEAST